MDMIQFITIMATMIGSVFAFYKLTTDRIDRMETHHREDMIRRDEKWADSDKRWDERFIRMDEKWERLFEKLLIKEEKQNAKY